MAHLANHYGFSHDEIMAMSLNWIFKYYINSFSLPYLINEENQTNIVISGNNKWGKWDK